MISLNSLFLACYKKQVLKLDSTFLFKDHFFKLIFHYPLEDAVMYEKITIQTLWLFLCLLIFLVGCNQTFQPIKENEDVPLSIYGYLDATADTQWVRVTPVRDQLNQLPVKPEMHVTLEHVKSGNKTVMNDSLF